MSDIVDTSPLGIERTERIAGDDALNSRLDTVTTELQGTQESVTTEVLHRSEGDLVIQRILEGYIQDLLEGKSEDFERYIEFQNSQNLNYADVRNFVGSIRASLAEDIRTLTASLMSNLETNDARYNKLVSDVDRYLEILSDVTLDSNQITLDDGELRAGAWTILSQAREWDLQILQKLNGLSTSVGDSLKDAVEELQNQLPSTEQTISKAIEELSKSSVISKLSDALNNVTTTQSDLLQQQVEEAVTRAQEISNLALIQATELANEKKQLTDQLNLEAQERIDAIAREREVRLNLIEELENGFTSRFDLVETEQSTSFTAFNNYKASTDNSLANFNTSINLISGDLASQGSVVSALDLRLKDNEETAVSAVTKSEAALTETSAQAEIINGITASLADKADASALSTLGTEISDLDGKLSLNTSSITQLKGSLDNVNDELSNKASLTALNSLSGNVETIGNQTIVNTNALTNLKNRVDVVEGAVAVKLDASVISDYYTKGQADDKSAEIAAGKIESYDANLVIGGTNLMEYTSGNAAIYGAGLTYDAVTNSFIKPSGAIYYTAFRLGSFTPKMGEVYTVSGYLYVDDQPANYSNYWTEHSTINSFQKSIGKVHIKSDGHFYGTYEVTDTYEWGAAHFFYPAGTLLDETQHTLRFKDLQLEKGSKPSAYSKPTYETQKSLSANANAIQTVNAEVARVNGEVVSTAESVSNLSSNVGLLQGSINEVRQTVTNNQESTNTLLTSLRSGMADADDVSMMMRNATVIFEDLTFKNGYNGVQVYNNYANGVLAANFTDKLPDNPVASTRQLQFIHSGGATTPGLGGFYQATQSRANGVFLVKFVAKLPVGFSFGLAANSFGDNPSYYFIGGSEGTGKFKTYYAVYRCGATGSFSTVGFVYVNGQQPTPENPLIWYLASSTVYDCLDSKVAPDSVVNGIAEAKSTASTAVNKAEATAQIAQELQAALDNTNATIATKYYTIAQTDTVVAGKVEEFSSTIAVGGANLWSVVNATRVSELGAHSVTVRREDEEELWITVDSLTDGSSLIRFDSCLVDQNTPFIDGEDVVLSFEVSSSGYHRLGTVYAYVGNAGSAVFNANLVLDPRKWTRIVHKFKATGVALDGASQLFGFHLPSAHGWNVGTSLNIRHVQLQRGNTATTFSKAPAITRATIKETTQSINGIEAVKTVTIDNNGVMSGYGLISQLKNGQVTSAFGVNADTFYIGGPALNKKPFLVTSYPQDIDGITYPAGTWINSAIIANATIGTAKIADLAVTGAKIANATIDNAKIANLDAAKINTGTLSAERIGSKSITSDHINVTSLSAISADLGTIQVGTANIDNGAITTAKIGDLQIDTLKIKDNAVTIQTAYFAQTLVQTTPSETAANWRPIKGLWCSGHKMVWEDSSGAAWLCTPWLANITLGDYTGVVECEWTAMHLYAANQTPWVIIRRDSTGECRLIRYMNTQVYGGLNVRTVWEGVAKNETFSFCFGTGGGQGNTKISAANVTFSIQGAKK